MRIRRAAALPATVAVACVGILIWRIPLLRRSGTHTAEASAFIGKPLPEALTSLVKVSKHDQGDAAYYVYAESCPYCGMDRGKVRKAAIEAAGGRLRFHAIHLGSAKEPAVYWEKVGLKLPDWIAGLNWERADSLGIKGVPLLFVVHREIVTAAWIGHIAWSEEDIRRGISCRVGVTSSCVSLYLADAARGLTARLGLLVGHATALGAGGGVTTSRR